jgi:hypothetical protein
LGAALGSQLLFITGDQNGLLRLWTTNGQSTGSINQLGTFTLSVSDELTPFLTPFSGGFLFNACKKPNVGCSVWVTDGTTSGTHALPAPLSTGPAVSYNGGVIFSGNNQGYGGIWKTDGTVDGTTLIDGATGGTGFTFIPN